jgi:hypothetical protein
VCSSDLVPHVLRALGDRFSELIIIADLKPPEGRIRELHGAQHTHDNLLEILHSLAGRDSRIRLATLPKPSEVPLLFDDWFSSTLTPVVRCQAGTPIYAYVYGIYIASNDIVLHLDSDILFKDSGWFDTMTTLLHNKQYAIVEPARFGNPLLAPVVISTRAFGVNRAHLKETNLPMSPSRLTGLRRWHRIATGRPTWLALEKSFEHLKQQGRLSHCILPASLGWSFHVPKIDHVRLSGFEKVVESVERDEMPESQYNAGWDFDPAAWTLG